MSIVFIGAAISLCWIVGYVDEAVVEYKWYWEPIAFLLVMGCAMCFAIGLGMVFK